MRCLLSSKTAATILSLGALLVAAASAGCSSQHKQTQREQALTQWNGARASVLGGLARDQYNSGNFEKCRLTLDEALKLEPKNAQLHVLSAKLAIEQGQLEFAERALAKFLSQQYRDAADVLARLVTDEKYAKRGDLYLALGECQMQLGNPAQARTSLDTASELMPAAPEVWLSLAKCSIASADFRRA